jgi:hypothetical protein
MPESTNKTFKERSRAPDYPMSALTQQRTLSARFERSSVYIVAQSQYANKVTQQCMKVPARNAAAEASSLRRLSILTTLG